MRCVFRPPPTVWQGVCWHSHARTCAAWWRTQRCAKPRCASSATFRARCALLPLLTSAAPAADTAYCHQLNGTRPGMASMLCVVLMVTRSVYGRFLMVRARHHSLRRAAGTRLDAHALASAVLYRTRRCKRKTSAASSCCRRASLSSAALRACPRRTRTLCALAAPPALACCSALLIAAHAIRFVRILYGARPADAVLSSRKHNDLLVFEQQVCALREGRSYAPAASLTHSAPRPRRSPC